MLYNINPNLWGPHGWKFMHYITMAYPESPSEQDKENIKNFFNSIKNVIPCENCRIHFVLNLKKYPLNEHVLKSRMNLISWLNDIHNEVNERTGKKKYTIDELLKEYDITQNNCNVEIVTVILLILIIIIIIIYIKIKYFS